MWVMVCAGMWAGEKIGLLKGRGLSLLLFIVWFLCCSLLCLLGCCFVLGIAYLFAVWLLWFC